MHLRRRTTRTSTRPRLACRARAVRHRLTPPPPPGALTRLDPVTRYGDREIDDHFFATAIALGAGNELASAFDSIIQVDAKRGGSTQVEYAHPVPIELPPRQLTLHWRARAP